MSKGVFNANTGHFAGLHIWSMAIGGIVGVTCGGLMSKQNILVERDFKPLPAFPVIHFQSFWQQTMFWNLFFFQKKTQPRFCFFQEFRRAVCFLRPCQEDPESRAWGYFVLSQADSEQRLKITGKVSPKIFSSWQSYRVFLKF